MWLELVTYACLLVFIAGIAWRSIRYARMPIHLRWELYPVAHEKGREYGGSYLEESEWWHHPRRKNMFGEFTTFMREILLFREYFKSRRSYWYLVYPFHIGLFLILAWVILLLLISILQLNGLPVHPLSLEPWIKALYYITYAAGALGFLLGLFGTAGLLIKRLSDEDMRLYTDPIDYFNLAWFLLIFMSGTLAFFLEDGMHQAIGFMQGLASFQPAAARPALTSFILLASLMLAYMPFTRMLHYVAKYFTYHKVRWDDEPNTRDSKLESKVSALLAQKESWSAPHVLPGKSWTEQAAQTGTQENVKPQ
jgi:nitrate reductase gamma subunit